MGGLRWVGSEQKNKDTSNWVLSSNLLAIVRLLTIFFPAAVQSMDGHDSVVRMRPLSRRFYLNVWSTISTNPDPNCWAFRNNLEAPDLCA